MTLKLNNVWFDDLKVVENAAPTENVFEEVKKGGARATIGVVLVNPFSSGTGDSAFVAVALRDKSGNFVDGPSKLFYSQAEFPFLNFMMRVPINFVKGDTLEMLVNVWNKAPDQGGRIVQSSDWVPIGKISDAPAKTLEIDMFFPTESSKVVLAKGFTTLISMAEKVLPVDINVHSLEIENSTLKIYLDGGI